MKFKVACFRETFTPGPDALKINLWYIFACSGQEEEEEPSDCEVTEDEEEEFAVQSRFLYTSQV